METTTNFSDLGIGASLISALNNINFDKASPIQEMTIEPIIAGEDIFAQAETGSGKTGSFSIPIIEKILRLSEDEQKKSYQYVILSPTRELAQQTASFFKSLGSDLGIKSLCVIGGESFDKQAEMLKDPHQVLIATPGRLCDLINQKVVDLSSAKGVVFDEADRLFDMGFKKDIEFILRKTPKDRQLIMVSATSNMDVLQTAYKFHSQPVELKLNEDSLLVENIDHRIAMITSDEKMSYLVNLLRKQISEEDVYALVFCNTQYQTHLVAEWLRAMNFKAKPISGRLAQNKRTKLMEDFRTKEITILVCTDVAARGLDIKDVNLVVNYDLPQDPANYVHRIGRTGRAGKVGLAISFCGHEDGEFLDPIYELIEDKIEKMDISDEDFADDIAPRPRIDRHTLKLDDGTSKRESRRGNDKGRDRDRGREKGRDKGRDRDGKSRDRKKNEMVHDPDFKLKEVKPTQFPTFVPTQGEKSRKVFVYETTDEKKVREAAKGYFRVLDDSLLDIKVLKKSMPKFFFFGPRKITYEVRLKNIYKKLLTPFFIEIIRLSHLRLFARVSFKDPDIVIHFSGPDTKLLTRNYSELLKSFEQLSKLFLYQHIIIPKESKIVFKVEGSEDREKSIKNLVDKMKARVLKDKKPIRLKPMNSMERRIVHQLVSKDDRIQSNSIGDGKLKVVELSLS